MHASACMHAFAHACAVQRSSYACVHAAPVIAFLDGSRSCIGRRCCYGTVLRSACFLSRAAFRCPLGPSPRTTPVPLPVLLLHPLFFFKMQDHPARQCSSPLSRSQTNQSTTSSSHVPKLARWRHAPRLRGLRAKSRTLCGCEDRVATIRMMHVSRGHGMFCHLVGSLTRGSTDLAGLPFGDDDQIIPRFIQQPPPS